eukprot:256452-Amphidinium_carterae.1
MGRTTAVHHPRTQECAVPFHSRIEFHTSRPTACEQSPRTANEALNKWFANCRTELSRPTSENTMPLGATGV